MDFEANDVDLQNVSDAERNKISYCISLMRLLVIQMRVCCYLIKKKNAIFIDYHLGWGTIGKCAKNEGECHFVTRIATFPESRTVRDSCYIEKPGCRVNFRRNRCCTVAVNSGYISEGFQG